MGLQVDNQNLLLPPSQLFKSFTVKQKKDSLPSFESIKRNDNINISPTYNIKPRKQASLSISLGLQEMPTISSKPKNFSLGSGSVIPFPGPATTGQNVISKSITNNSSSLAKLTGIPERNPYAMTGSEFIESTKGLKRDKREEMVLNEIIKGNIPDFARNLKEVNVTGIDKQGTQHTGKIFVMPDYLAIGSNDDFIRIPMNPLTAQKIANETKTFLPTRKIVNDIYTQATVKLKPQPIEASPKMMSSTYYQNHNNLVKNQINGFIKKQLQQIGIEITPKVMEEHKKDLQGQLTAGHKKDVVISTGLVVHPKKVAIYGLHKPDAKAIQPLSTIHENTYADYSHGVRLVGGTMIVDGEKKNIADVLKDNHQSWVISDQGKINQPYYK